MFINNQDHITKVAAVPKYEKKNKKTLKIFFSGNVQHIATKLNMQQLRLEKYNVFINHDLAIFYSKVNLSHICRSSCH